MSPETKNLIDKVTSSVRVTLQEDIREEISSQISTLVETVITSGYRKRISELEEEVKELRKLKRAKHFRNDLINNMRHNAETVESEKHINDMDQTNE